MCFFFVGFQPGGCESLRSSCVLEAYSPCPLSRLAFRTKNGQQQSRPPLKAKMKGEQEGKERGLLLANIEQQAHVTAGK